MAGRPLVPTAVKRARGTLKPSRENTNEPEYAVEAPEKPSQVAARAEASAKWDTTLAEMLEKRTMAKVYLGALAGYCLAWADLCQCEDLKAAPGFVWFVEGPQGQKAHPVFKEIAIAHGHIRQYASALGITPTTVGKVTAAAPVAEASKLQAILGRRRSA